ncbi:N-acetylglucosamine transport system permease protein [Gemmiger formicilis]|uniref:N-acetylglucosamine transport system permease protein n=1 Tax=Gemmiger formicilis TaxID=745368 RepID=A0A1T4XTX6_9FIRM|nr:sugar ABC transporter permease [Gemmiger formicilis]SKA92987.1 N-acetylglucosamine transport system permease protein [Gemmiger formicilis]
MKNRQNRQKKAQPLPVLFVCISVLPAVILTLMFTIWPTAQALYLSFTNATSLGLNNKFVGLDNYIYMFHDKSFIQALINTAKLMAVVPVITIFCSLVLAFVLNQCKLKEMVLYRTIFYFPNIVSLTVVGIIWSFVFHPNVGIVNKILGAVGLESLQRSWLGDSKTALWCIAFTLLWQAAGYYMVMHIAAMDGISPEIYESATLDGASAWRKLVSITMPLMKDIIGITFVLALSGTINLSFVLSQVMTGGGPNGASSVLLQYMYTQGFVNGNFGYAMAITVFTLAISVALSMLSRKLTDASEGGQ